MQQTLCGSNAAHNVGIQNPKTVTIIKLFYNCSKVYFKTNASGRRLLSLVTSLRISVTAVCFSSSFDGSSVSIPVPAVITFDYIT
jgi:hypothetical protein